jgi:hypothetical protein
LCTQHFEWLGSGHKFIAVQDFGDKSRVQQVQDGVFNATHVNINGHPSIDDILVKNPYQ